jgi:hypothetical protein
MPVIKRLLEIGEEKELPRGTPSGMADKDDSPTLGEQMNRALYLDPGFKQDKPNLVSAIRDDIDDTTKRAQANLDQQRQNASDVEEIAAEIAEEKAEGVPPGLPDEP